MYTAFYGLREKPFALSPDPRFLYLAESHREALAHLLYGVEQGEGFICVTGEVGTGKTTLCRALLRRLGPDLEVAFLFNPKLTPRELLEAMHVELGIRSEGDSLRELVDALNRLLLEKRRDAKRVLLIVDEAQGLPAETLEQIRLLSNLETESDKLIQILLLGQPELDAMLESPSLRQLRQRIGVRWRLAPLAPRETREYARHRLQVAAGEERDLLSEAALREVHRRSGGIPRRINLLCDRALLAGYAQGAARIGPDLVRRADRELRGVARRGWRARLRPALVLPALALFVLAGGLTWRFAACAGSPATSVAAEKAAPPRPEIAVAAVPAAEPSPSALGEPPSSVGQDAGGPEPLGAEALAPQAPIPAVAKATGPPAGPERVADLPRVLAGRPPGATVAEALTAVLQAWELDGSTRTVEFVSFPQALGELAARGFAILSLPQANLAELRALGHPSLLMLEAADGVPRAVALRRIDDEHALLFGVAAERAVEVSLRDLAESWRGEAYVAWRDFEALPEVLRWGARGPGVAWLQRALADLGFLRRSPSGVFDDPTYYAVQAFQRQRELLPDGAVGPITKIALYDALPRYVVPRLAGSEESG